jgi:O-antigen/teichoic acid export membrane protein
MSDKTLTTTDKDSGLIRIFKNTAWLLAGKGFGGILSLVYLAIITRTLGVEGFGQFALITGTAAALITFVSFQTWQVIARFGPGHLKQADGQGAFMRLIGLCALFDLVGALAGCLLIVIGTQLAAPYFGWDAKLADQALWFSAVMLLSLKSTPTGILRVLNRFDLGTYAEAVIPIMRLVGVLAAWILAPKLEYFLLAWAVSEVVHAIAYWTLALKMTGHITGRVFRSKQAYHYRTALAENQGLGSFLLVTNIGSTLAGFSQNIAVLVVGFFAGPFAAGLFRLASQISSAMTKISTLLSRSIFAEVNQVRSLRGDQALKDLFGSTIRFLFVAGLAVMLLVILLGEQIIQLMSGEAFLGAYPLLILLAGAACLDLAGAMFEPTLLSGKAAGSTLWLNAITAIGFAILLALLLPPYGVTGAAWAMLLASMLRLLLFGIAAYRHLADIEES